MTIKEKGEEGEGGVRRREKEEEYIPNENLRVDNKGKGGGRRRRSKEEGEGGGIRSKRESKS